MRDFVALMRPTSEQLGRNRQEAQGPRWFSFPISQAGFSVHFTRFLPEIARIIRGATVKPILFVFNVSLLEYLAVARFRKACTIVSLYQWRPLSKLPGWKRSIYHSILASSDRILVYSKRAAEHLRREFPRIRIQWIGLFTDTEYFDPSKADPVATRNPFLLVPGNHKRDEQLIKTVAERLNITVVRVTTNRDTVAFHCQNRSQYVKVISGASFRDVRNLYASAALVLNIADDSEWPVGITTFCEALSMNVPVLTGDGHSASGYSFEDGTKPYATIDGFRDVNALLFSVAEMLGSPSTFEDGRSPRALADQLCSMPVSIRDWSSLKDLGL